MGRGLKVGDEVRPTAEFIRAIGAQTEPDVYNDVGVVAAPWEAGDYTLVYVDWDIRGYQTLVRASSLERTQ